MLHPLTNSCPVHGHRPRFHDKSASSFDATDSGQPTPELLNPSSVLGSGALDHCDRDWCEAEHVGESLFPGETLPDLEAAWPVPSAPEALASPPRAPAKTRARPAPTTANSRGASVRPLAQSNASSCGQTSVAMSINALTGKKLTDREISRRYGYALLFALNEESKGSAYRWRDGGDFRKKSWPTLEKKLNKERTPVLIGLNGPNFSPSGRGHIVTLLSIEGEKVRYADPATGTIRVTTRRAIENAPPHPDGKFLFYASRKA